MTETTCEAYKKISYDTNEPEIITIQHFGHHDCVALPHNLNFPEEELNQIFQMMTNIRPSHAQNIYLRDVFDKEPNKLQERSQSVLDLKKIQNTKNKLNKERGHESIESVIMKAQSISDIIIEEVCPSILAMTSFSTLDLLFQLSSPNNLPEGNDRYLHMDFLPGRIKDKSVLGIHYYVPHLKETVTTVKFYTDSEDNHTVSKCLNWLNQQLSNIYGNDNILLPYGGWMLDEAGALQIGLQDVYGPHIQLEIANCQAHFMASAVRNSNKGLGSDGKIYKFRTLAKKLMTPQT